MSELKFESAKKLTADDTDEADQKDIPCSAVICFICGQWRSIRSLIALVALAFINLCLRVLAYVLAERAADVITFLKLSVIVASYVTLIRTRVDQFTFIFFFSFCHDASR